MLKKKFLISAVFAIFAVQSSWAATVSYRCKGDTGWATHGAADEYEAMVGAMALGSSICGDLGYEIARQAVGTGPLSPILIVDKPSAVKPISNVIIRGGSLPVIRPGGSLQPIYKISPTPVRGVK